MKCLLSKVLIFLLTFNVVTLHSMEPSKREKTKKTEQKINQESEKTILKVPGWFPEGTIVSQGKFYKNQIGLDLSAKEPIAVSTFKELLDEQHKNGLPLVLAMVTTIGGKDNSRNVSFYTAETINKHLKQTIAKNRYTIGSAFFKDPINNQPIIGQIVYIEIPLKSKEFTYLCTDADLFFGDAKLNKFWLTYLAATEVSNVKAQVALAYMYESGQNTKKDLQKAFVWYDVAAQQGYAPAQSNIAFFYAQGKVVQQDFKQAFEWYQKAALQNDVGAQENLGLLYEHGKGVEKNIEQAKYWYKKAMEQASELAQERLENIK